MKTAALLALLSPFLALGCDLDPDKYDQETIDNCLTTQQRLLKGCMCTECTDPYKPTLEGSCYAIKHCTDVFYCSDCDCDEVTLRLCGL